MNAEQIRLKLTQALAHLDSLPAMPVIAQKLLGLQLDTAQGEAQLLTLIAQDPQISAKLIGLANSPVMGLSRKAASVSDAAMLLGLTRVKAVAHGIAAMTNFPKLVGSQNFAPQDLWLHSLTIAIAMHTLSQYMPEDRRPPQDLIYLAGLLHDMGYMAIHYLDSAASNELHHQLHLQPRCPVVEVELRTLGISHCEVGARLARQWHLPETLVAVLGQHHTPYLDDVPADQPLPRLVNLAEKLLPNFGITQYCGTEIRTQEWQALGIDPEKAGEIRDNISEIAIQTAQIADIF